MKQNLRILVVEPNPERVRSIIDALRDAGWSDVKALAQMSALGRTVKDFAPDIVLIDLTNPDRDTLEHISHATETSKRAVALFVDQTGSTAPGFDSRRCHLAEPHVCHGVWW
jgi:response regulator NasT